jgi:hypothetical protein
MDGDILLSHIIDVGAIESASADNIEFRVRKDDDETRVELRIRTAEFTLGEKFLWDALFGFETLNSVAARAGEMASRLLEEFPELESP